MNISIENIDLIIGGFGSLVAVFMAFYFIKKKINKINSGNDSINIQGDRNNVTKSPNRHQK